MQNQIYENDFSIEELPEPIRELLHQSNLPWFNSLAFCTGYDAQPATRVWIKMVENNIHKAVFYRLTKRFLLNSIDIIGFPDISEVDFDRLLKLHNAQLTIVNRLEKAVKPDEEWYPTNKNVYRHSYVTVVPLPSSKEEYLQQLGKNKRKQLPQWFRRLHRYFNDDIEIRYDTKGDIRLEDIIQIDYLNNERRSGKGKIVDTDAAIQERQKRLFPIAQKYGLLVTIRHQGKILGGNLNYIYGDTGYMVITGHNPELEELRVGNLAIWKTMDYLIDNGLTACNFQWGRRPYKTQFLGVEYPWSVHIVSPYPVLAGVWKYYIQLKAFSERVLHYAKSRLSISFNVTLPDFSKKWSMHSLAK
jgi:hypothetical protein